MAFQYKCAFFQEENFQLSTAVDVALHVCHTSSRLILQFSPPLNEKLPLKSVSHESPEPRADLQNRLRLIVMQGLRHDKRGLFTCDLGHEKGGRRDGGVGL